MSGGEIELDERPPSRPVDGLVLGVLAAVAVAAAVWWLLVGLVAGESFQTDPWLWAATSINYLAHLAGLPPLPRASAWALQTEALRAVIGWRILVAVGAGGIAGLVLGVVGGRAPPAARIVGGRRITRNPDEFRRSLGLRERRNGVALHPNVKIDRNRETNHFLLVAGPGSGKTQAILPMICAARKRGDRMLIYDFKGDLTEFFLDDDAVLLAPWDGRSAHWDIASDVPDLEAASELAAALVPAPRGSDNPMWSQGARQIMTGLISALQQRGPWGVADLARSLARPTTEIAATLRQYHPEAAGFLAAPEQATAMSYMSNLKSGLAGLYGLARMAGEGRGTFSVRGWLAGDGPNVLIVQHSESRGDLSRMLLGRVNNWV